MKVVVGRFYGMLHLSAKRHRFIVWWEDALWKTFLGNHVKDLLFHLVHWLEYHPITAKDQSRIHQFGKKILHELFLGYALYATGIWKGDVLVADLEELETMDASEIYSKRLNAKRSGFSHKEKGELIFPIADGRIKPLRGDQELRTSTLIRPRPVQGETHLDFLGESEGSLPPPHDSFSDAGFLFHWNTLTYPELHIRIWMLNQEKRIDDYWNIEMDDRTETPVVASWAKTRAIKFLSWGDQAR